MDEKNGIQTRATPAKHRHPLVPRPDDGQLLLRLRRIEGQVRGVQRMIEEDRYCVDILHQISAIQAALGRVGLALLEQHARGCVAHAIEEGDGQAAVDELVSVVKEFVK